MDKRIEPPRGYPETPVKLPANTSPARYGSDLIAELLSAMSFEHAFVLPGSSYRGLHDSLVNHTRNTRPEIVLCTTELIAVSMAHGYAKATRKPALAIIHDLVGLMVASMSVYNAFVDQQPVVILGGAGPLDPARRRTIDWVHTANAQSDLVKKFCKWTAEPATLQATLDAILRAHRIAATPPYGPVYVSIDQSVQEELIKEGVTLPDVGRTMYQPPTPMAADPIAIEHAAEMLLEAKMPLIMAGRIGIDPAATAPLSELVELTGAAYLDDRNMSCLATDHPQNLSGDDSIKKEADIVLTIECVDIDTAIGRGPKGRQVIDMSLTGLLPNSWTNVGGPLPAVDLQIACSATMGMAQLAGAVRKRLAQGTPEGLEARKAALKKRHDDWREKQRTGWRARWNEVPILRAHLTEALYDAVKHKDWCIVVRNNRGLDEGIWRLPGAGYYLGGDGGGGVGYAPGAGIGAAMALTPKGKFCIALMGDGEFNFSAGALWTAAHYRVPLLIVITNNTSWGNDEHHQLRVAAERGRPQENAWIGQRMFDPDIDFAALARAYDVWAEGPVVDPANLASVFRRAVAAVESGKTAVVDVRVQL
jgi:acetolactate synthase-1/2/3 large subunit